MGAFPPDVSTTGYLVDRLFWLATGLTSVAFAAVVGALGYFLVRYRARPGWTAFYTHGNSRRALLLTGGLALAVFFLIDRLLHAGSVRLTPVIELSPDPTVN